MKRIHFILLAIMAIFLVACKEKNAPSPGGNSGGSDSGKTPSTYADFEYNFIDYNMINIKDKSIGKDAVYDFGDGEKKPIKLPYEYLILHIYEKEGTYTITVQVNGEDGTIKKQSKQITIKKPQTYIAGIKYISVDVPYEYYMAKLVDDDPITTTWFTTDYTQAMLYPDILPQSYMFYNPILMNGLKNDEYYTLYIYHNTKNSGTGTQCLKQTIYSAVFEARLPYIEVKNNSGNTVVQLLMEYK